MKHDTVFVEAADGVRLAVERWLPTSEPTAVIHLVHGMAEHAARYEHVARWFTERGWAVHADDHRGHGKTAASTVNAGHFADTEGWEVIMTDQRLLLSRCKADHPGLPLVVVGHSMGSIIARDIATRWGQELSALVLTGAPGPQGPLGRAARTIAAREVIKGASRPSELMNRLAFGSYNKGFQQRTEFDWLSRDEAVVDAYVSDPMCGFLCSAGFYRDMLAGLERVTDPKVLDGIPSRLPVLVASGGEDPATNKAKATRAISRSLARAGLTDVTAVVFEGARHEIFNETNRDEVLAVTCDWIERRLTR